MLIVSIKRLCWELLYQGLVQCSCNQSSSLLHFVVLIAYSFLPCLACEQWSNRFIHACSLMQIVKLAILDAAGREFNQVYPGSSLMTHADDCVKNA